MVEELRSPSLSLTFVVNGLAVLGKTHPVEMNKTERVLYPENTALAAPVLPRPRLTPKERPDGI